MGQGRHTLRSINDPVYPQCSCCSMGCNSSNYVLLLLLLLIVAVVHYSCSNNKQLCKRVLF